MRKALVALLFLAVPSLALAQRPAATDTVRAGRYDMGRMWTFEYPPVTEFSRYGFAPDSAWFARMRMAALRVPGCSASFVSADGLIITNHHCARGSISAVARQGEALLDSGFVARTIEEERRIPNYYADQLIAAHDVSDEVNAAADRAAAGPARDAARRTAGQAVQARLRQQYAGTGDSIWVQIVPLYSGARTSAYVFRRYTDIRLVVAPEVLMGFFGGDWDNYTFPRYDLDFTVLRAYGPDGRPVRSEHFYRWGGTDGVRDGDVVFVIGNPGQTARLTTMSQLGFQRDVTAPVQHAFLTSRLAAMQAYRQASPDEAERYDIRNRMFGLSNSMKSLGGRIEALHDAVIMARRADTERQLMDSIRARPALQQRYGRVFAEMGDVQRLKERQAVPYRAFATLLGSGGSATLQVGYWAWRVQRGPADSVAVFRERLTRVAPVPQALERRYLALALGDIARAYGETSEVGRAALGGRTPDAAAEQLLGATALTDPDGVRRAAAGELAADPVMRLIDVVAPRAIAMQAEMARLGARENELAAQIGRARFEVYGPSIPPDGSFSLRIADGTVQGYEYNGTWAAPFTTFYGMYDRFRANGPGTDWDLPHRWRTPPAGLDLGTPLNFVSTADSYGGNSGSPAVTRDLRIVGLNFDRNINALVRDYIYLPERGRNVMVDVRAVHAALRYAYGADRIVAELVAGRRP
jgi:hypothetical protein